MVEIAIIADDLTGAADTGVQFCPYFSDTILTSYSNLSPDFVGVLSSSLEALSVYTNSRSLKTILARDRLCAVARQLLLHQPKHIYKKIDSCLRGNLGVEVEAIMDEMKYELSFIAPAFPRMGRTTFHDVHLIDGTPAAQTELSQDPVTPVTESRLSQVVRSEGSYQVGHVDLRFLDGGDNALVEEIDRLVCTGARHLVFDATQQKHLDKIAHLAVFSTRKILLVGSAGLAESLGRHFPKRRSLGEKATAIASEGHHLLVCGTASEHTKEQVARLVETYCYETITLRPSLLADSTRRKAFFWSTQKASSLLSENNLIVRIALPELGAGDVEQKSRPWTAEQIVDGLGFFVASVLRETRPASLFLTGGDTANAVLKAIGAKGIRLGGEIVPGMAHGTLIGGLIDRLPIITKAGAFGKRDTLVALHDYWEIKSLPVKKNRF
jgi:uncharacterized protein YgbK (DUF1537 family)